MSTIQRYQLWNYDPQRVQHEKMPPMIREDPDHLFDLDSVAANESSFRTPGKVRKRIISVTSPVLKGSTISLRTEKYVKYEEVPEVQDPIPALNIFKPCSTDEQLSGHSPCMPSLRLEMREREYDEPVRNRDKDWILDSQRPIFNEKGKDIVSPVFELPLGKYKKVETVSKQFWAKEYQTMLRECLLLRHAAIISDTNCIVEIFGVGFTGRLFSDGGTSPKLLVIEVYSIWNSQKYNLVLTVMELRLLLVNHPDLLKPGRRADLLQFLLGALYFEYTITIPPRDSGKHANSSAVYADAALDDPSQPPNEQPRRKRGKKPPAHHHDAHAHVSKQERATFRHNLQRELAHQHHHALSDAQVEAIIPVNTHHDPGSHIEVHIDHSVPHLQIHFEPEPGTEHAVHHHAHHDPHYIHSAASRPVSPRHKAHGTHDPHSAGHSAVHGEAIHHDDALPPPQTAPAQRDARSPRAPDPTGAHTVFDESLQQPHDGTDTLAASMSDTGTAVEHSDHTPFSEATEGSGKDNGGTGVLSSKHDASDKIDTPKADVVAVDPFSVAQVQTVVHLEPPAMPRGYPTTVEQMIRVPPVRPEGSQDPLPIVTQQLHIGSYRRINGPMLRKQQAEEKRIAEEREEARLRAIWLATPKRRRNLKGIRLIRRCNYMVLLTGYFDPLRPNTIVLSGMVSNEATRMSMFLGLGKIKEMLHIDTSAQTWSSDELNQYVTSVLRFGGIIKTDTSNGFAINITQASGLETALLKPHTVSEFLAALRARQRRTHSAQMNNPDSLSPYYAGYLEDLSEDVLFTGRDQLGVSRPSTAQTFDEDKVVTRPTTAEETSSPTLATQADLWPTSDAPAAPPAKIATPLNHSVGWTSLGCSDSSRAVGAALGTVLRPWREIGKHRRLSSRAVRIQHVHCVYAIYADTTHMKNHREKSIPTWPTVDPNALNAASVAEEQSVAPESDDEDFLKAGGDSDSDSDESDAGTGARNRGRKGNKGKKKSSKGRGRMSSDLGSLGTTSDLFKDEDGSNLVDLQNDAYASMAEGLVLEMIIYIPQPSEFQELPIPAGDYRMAFTVDELDPIFPAHAEKERIFRALRAVYQRFFDTATGEEVRQAEEDWDWFGRTLLKRARWAVRGGLPSRVATAVSDLQQSNLGIDLLQEMFSTEERMLYVQTLLYSNAQMVASAAVEEKSLFSDGPSMKLAYHTSVKMPLSLTQRSGTVDAAAPTLVVEDTPPHVTLTWPRTVWTKVMKIRCASGDRGEFVRLQVRRRCNRSLYTWFTERVP
jgi:hypothetical protein